MIFLFVFKGFDCTGTTHRQIYDQMEGTIQSPNFPQLVEDQRCPYVFGHPEAKMIEITFSHIELGDPEAFIAVGDNYSPSDYRKRFARELTAVPSSPILLWSHMAWILPYSFEGTNVSFSMTYRIG